jgi:hypothetical protein
MQGAARVQGSRVFAGSFAEAPGVARYVFAIYEPPTPDVPWLAVTLEGDRAVDTFACPSLRAADRVLHSMQHRWTLKDRQDRHALGHNRDG